MGLYGAESVPESAPDPLLNPRPILTPASLRSAPQSVTDPVPDPTKVGWQSVSQAVQSGHPCGEDFLAAPFFAAHPEFGWRKSILHDMKAGPWTTFVAGEKK